MSRTVRDKRDEALSGTRPGGLHDVQQTADLLNHIEITALVTSADVVRLTDPPELENLPQGPRMIISAYSSMVAEFGKC
jgi:hypothetical protein